MCEFEDLEVFIQIETAKTNPQLFSDHILKPIEQQNVDRLRVNVREVAVSNPGKYRS